MALPDYNYLYDHACERKGGEKALKALLPKTKSKAQLKKLGSDRYLAEFTRKIFQSGFVWRVVDKKWPQFEEVFWEFDVERLLMMPDDMLERKAKDPAIIRNFSKVKTVRENAMMIDDTERREKKAFGEFIAGWPSDDVVGLWLYLKKHGSRLGGNTGPFALRTIGVDTFLFTQDVEGFLRSHGIVDGGRTSQRALKAAQAYFNDLREQSGRPLAELSRIISFVTGRIGSSKLPPMNTLMMMRGLAAGALTLLLAACAETTAPPSAIEQLADEYLEAWMEEDALMGTYYAIEGASHDQFPDNSLAGLAAWQEKEDAWLARLQGIPAPTEIGSRDWVTYGLLKEQLESAVSTRICRDELWAASTTTSWHTWIPFVFDIQPLETPELRAQALTRFAAMDTYIDNEIDNLREGLRLGYSAPRVTVEAVPAQVRSLIGPDSIFLGPAQRSDDAAFSEAAEQIYNEEIAPALNRFADFIENEYLSEARETLAVSGNPNGEACYPALVRGFVTVGVPAAEIHAVGLEQVAKIREEIQVTLDEHFGGGDVSEFLRRVNEDPAFTFDTEEAVLKYSTDALDAVKAAMPKAFGVLPKADVLVKPYPEFAESGSGEYHSSSEDGTRPGIFYIAVADPTGRSISNQLATLHHETFPGHHLQGAIALELGDQQHPLARYLWNSGYGEGWALYSERLADELGLYPTPLDRIGLYSDQIARASRLVMDSGLHTLGWTRQQTVDYMMANSGWAPVDIQNEIDRYISWPAQATSYMLGMIEIRRLRTLAEETLGDDFDLRGFHDRVVGMGSITLPMLEESIEVWIAEQQAGG